MKSLLVFFSVLIMSAVIPAHAQGLELTIAGSKGFPAISAKGDAVAVVVDENTYDDERNFDLQVYSAASRSLSKTFEIYHGPVQQEGKSPKPIQDKLAAAKQFLEAGHYQSLTKIEADQTAEFYILFKSPSLSLFQKQKLLTKLELPSMNSEDPACLADGGSKTECTYNRVANFVGAWISSEHKVLFIEYGYYSGRDGSEVGPLFKIGKY